MGRSWKDLIVWQKSHELVLYIYGVLEEFPKEEKYSLVSQIKRAAISIPTNIVEGHSKNSNKEFLKFLYISRGSLEEVKYLLILSRDLNYISEEIYQKLEEKLSKIGMLLNNLIKSIDSRTTSTTHNTNTTRTTRTTHNTHTTPKTKGFTLIELVIVIILVGIVAMVVAPKITTSDIEKNAEVVQLMSDIRYVQHKSMVTGGGKGILFTTHGYNFLGISDKEDISGLSAITPPSQNPLYFDYLGRPDTDNISTNDNIITNKITITIGGKNIYIAPYAGGVYE